MVVNYGGARPAETRTEAREYTPEQARAMGKTLGPLNKENVPNWIARVSSLPDISSGDVAFLARERMSSEDFGFLPALIQVANVTRPLDMYLGIH